MEHYITGIYIEKLRHLSDIHIPLDSQKRQHLLITGKNGSGKTTLLLAIRQYLTAINEGKLNEVTGNYTRWVAEAKQRLENAVTEKEKFEAEKDYKRKCSYLNKYKNGIDLSFNKSDDLDAIYQQGKFITAYFPANRKTVIERANGVSDVKLQDFYGIDTEPGKILLKYMVHLKTQQAYARNEGDMSTVQKIQKWFERFEAALQVLLDNDSISLEYDYKEYDFKIREKERNMIRFDQLSDGYSSLIHIVSDLILRMDKNWLLGEELSSYDIEGIVLIDELETHLHIELQKKILPFLTEFFPKVQFIVTTHSPYILSSISNAKCYDLERNVELENLSFYSSEELAEGYFNADEYSEELKKKIARYRYLVEIEHPSEEERAERARIRMELKNIPAGMGKEIRQMFEEIESGRKKDG